MSKPDTTHSKPFPLKINWTGVWIPVFRKDGMFDGYKWVACAEERSAEKERKDGS